MIDFDKFIYDFLLFKPSKEQKNTLPVRGSYYQANAALKYIRFSIDYALKQQGLEYKEGAIVPIENKPKFKIGQTIVYKGTENIAPTKMTITEIVKGQYWDDNCCIIPISDQDNWELEKTSTIKFDEESPQTLDEISKNGYVDMNRPIELTIQDEPDFERMEAEYCTTLDISNGVIDAMIQSKMCGAYRKGLEDMWKKLKSKYV